MGVGLIYAGYGFAAVSIWCQMQPDPSSLNALEHHVDFLDMQVSTINSGTTSNSGTYPAD